MSQIASASITCVPFAEVQGTGALPEQVLPSSIDRAGMGEETSVDLPGEERLGRRGAGIAG